MKHIVSVVFCAFLLVGASSLLHAGSFKVGDQVTPVSLKDGVDEKVVTLDEKLFAENAKTVLAFMNTACKACQQEISLLSKLSQRNPELKVFAVAVDMRGKEAIASYSTRFNFNVTYLLDSEFTVPPMFGFSYTPAMVVVDKTGKITGMKSGFVPGRDEDEIIAMVK